MAQDAAEKLDPPRKRDASFYFVLCFVAPLWAIIPISWVFVIYVLRSGIIWSLSWHGIFIFALALCEVFFSIHHYRLVQSISGPSPTGQGNLTELQAAYTRVLKAGLANLPADGFDEETLNTERPGSPAEDIVQLEKDDPRAVDFRNVLRTWFGRVPWSELRYREVYAWLYWSTFNTRLPPMESLPHAHRVALEDAFDLLQKRSGCTIPKGSNPSVKPLLLTIDKINVMWRPLIFYVIVAVINRILKTVYQRKWGVRCEKYNDLEYLIRIPKKWNQSTDPRPIVFIHGLGLGLAQYNVTISHLLETFEDRPLLIPLQPHISQDIFHPRYLSPLGRHEAAESLAGLLRELGWVEKKIVNELGITEDEQDEYEEPSDTKVKKGVTMLSHSNGSYFHAWMLKAHGKMVARSCFVDPVTFCSWEGHTCFNFIYRPCKTGIELLMRYFVSTEIGVANLLQRHFDWSSNALWYEEIPNARDPSKTMFILGGKDEILDAARVKRYLCSHGVRKGLWLDPDGRHGQALIRGGEGHAKILRWLQEDH